MRRLLATAHALLLLALTLPAAAEQRFNLCLDSLRQQASSQGIHGATLDLAFADISQRPEVLQKDRGGQSEFIYTFWHYLGRSVSPERIETGRNQIATHRELLEQISRQYGVPYNYLVALWGLETNFGRYLGDIPTLDALATLACDQRRSNMFSRQFVEALRLVDQGKIARESMRGSWAGAMGQVQFMPGTYALYAVDYDGNGRTDLWNDLPDVFASAANYLNRIGWKEQDRWGREVRVPRDLPWSLTGIKGWRPMSEWRRLGVRQVDGSPLPEDGRQAALLAPEGYEGPCFLVYDNFKVVMRWNASSYYALAVGHLADRLAGGPELHARPPVQTFYRRAEAVEIQQRLTILGYELGQQDGLLGGRTQAAIKQFQSLHGLPVDGYPSQPLLEQLRRLTPSLAVPVNAAIHSSGSKVATTVGE